MDDHAAQAVARPIVQQLQDAWNAADGGAFGAPFTEDADYVTIRGEQHRGRETIAHGHQAIFDTIYRGSTLAYELVQARAVAGDVILAHVRSRLTALSGPLAGEHHAVGTLILVGQGGGWSIAAMHNTLVTPPR